MPATWQLLEIRDKHDVNVVHKRGSCDTKTGTWFLKVSATWSKDLHYTYTVGLCMGVA